MPIMPTAVVKRFLRQPTTAVVKAELTLVHKKVEYCNTDPACAKKKRSGRWRGKEGGRGGEREGRAWRPETNSNQPGEAGG